MKRCTVFKLNEVPYDEALSFQFELAERVKDKKGKETFLILLEHPPVITLGKNGNGANVLVSPETLKKKGIELKRIGRGGDATYHGPGQLVGYPILSLAYHKKSIREYVARLEETMIKTLDRFGIKAERNSRNAGAWVGDAKIGFVGVRISRGISHHGFSLNVDPDLKAFDLIHPCGLKKQKVTSLSEQKNKKISVNEVAKEYLKVFSDLFGVKTVLVRTHISYIPKVLEHA